MNFSIVKTNPNRAWIFNTYNGHQVITNRYRNQLGIGVCPGKVRYVTPMVLTGVNVLLQKQT
ncbi:MAG: hypothetical protein OEV64_07995 [Desulfobulbaceae bacterium]|nr:hypothetical protein [Desulfobulbaceae bacterium]